MYLFLLVNSPLYLGMESTICSLNYKQVVNLIPFNPIGSSSNFKTSSDQNVKKFQKVMRGVYNIRTTVRQQMGQDIAGACGQLVVSLPDERSTGGATLLSDIEDLRI